MVDLYLDVSVDVPSDDAANAGVSGFCNMYIDFIYPSMALECCVRYEEECGKLKEKFYMCARSSC